MVDPGRNPLTHVRSYEDEMPHRLRISPITSDCVILSGLKRHSGEMPVPQTAYAVFGGRVLEAVKGHTARIAAAISVQPPSTKIIYCR